jgi:hypothetical protein
VKAAARMVRSSLFTATFDGENCFVALEPNDGLPRA